MANLNQSYVVDLPQERRQLMLAKLNLEGKVVAAELSDLYQVSIDTIRRDLRELALEGKLKRVHGGALPTAPDVAPYAERSLAISPAKRSIARTVAGLVRDDQVVIFGSGTTNAEIARHLPRNLRITAVTPSPQIALRLAEYPHIEVVLIGGRLNKRDLVVADAQAVEQMKQFQADVCFLGICSLHPEVGYTTNAYEEVALNRVIIAQSGEVVAATTVNKFGTIAPYVVAPINTITQIITENEVTEEILAPYRQLGIEIVQTRAA